MAYVYKDRVKEPSTSTGTGAIVGSGAASPKFLPLSTIGNSNTFAYTIEHDSLSEWEVGIGTYTTAGNSFTRDLVLASSNANALVTFSAGSKTVFNTLPAARIHPPLGNTQVGVGDSNSVLSGSSELIYDSIGLRHIKAQNAVSQIVAVNTDAGGAAQARFNCANGTNNLWLQKNGTGYTTTGLAVANQGWLYNTDGSTLFSNNVAADFIWSSGGIGVGNEKMRLLANGNWSLSGTSGATPEVSYDPTTGSNARLLVQKSSANITDIGAINPNTGTTSYGQVYAGNGASYLIMIKTSTGYTPNGLQGAGMGVIGNTNGALLTYNGAAADMIWSIGGVAVASEKMRLNTAAQLTVYDSSTGGYAGLRVSNDNARFNIYKFGSAWPGNGLQVANQAYLENATGQTMFVNTTANDYIWTIGGFAAGNEAMRLRADRLTVAGKPVMCYRGPWVNGTVYGIGDVIYYGGNNYNCLIASNNVVPTNTSYWQLMTNNHGRPQLTDAATTTWDVAATPVAWWNPAAARTLSITNSLAGQTYALQIQGGYTITWPSIVHWPNGNRAPVSSAGGFLDVFTFVCLVDNGYLAGAFQLGYQ